MAASDAESNGADTNVTETASLGVEDPPAVAPPAEAKAKGRPRARPQRPRIDLDEQISQANQLAQVTKKMLNAARSAQRNQKRQKQRLIRKAGKLSAQDLERIAVLKRCGLYADDDEEPTGSSSSRKEDTTREVAPVAGPQEKKKKLSDVVSQIAGTEVVLHALQAGPSSSGSFTGLAASPGTSSAASASGNPDGRPRGTRLVRALSKPSVTNPTDGTGAA